MISSTGVVDVDCAKAVLADVKARAVRQLVCKSFMIIFSKVLDGGLGLYGHC